MDGLPRRETLNATTITASYHFVVCIERSLYCHVTNSRSAKTIVRFIKFAENLTVSSMFMKQMNLLRIKSLSLHVGFRNVLNITWDSSLGIIRHYLFICLQRSAEHCGQ